MARARFSGSLDLKIPDPTKTASAPSCRTSAASAGVAIPPAEKFGTGSLPLCATSRTSSSGAASSLAACTSSSPRSVVRRRISLVIARAANERHFEVMLPNVIFLVRGGQHFAFVDEIDFQRLEHLRFGEMADARLGHHRDAH